MTIKLNGVIQAVSNLTGLLSQTKQNFTYTYDNIRNPPADQEVAVMRS